MPKLKRPPITEGPWVIHAGRIQHFAPQVAKSIFAGGMRFDDDANDYKFTSPENEANYKAAVTIPEVMDFLESQLKWAKLMGGWEWDEKLIALMKRMGYTEEKEEAS